MSWQHPQNLTRAAKNFPVKYNQKGHWSFQAKKLKHFSSPEFESSVSDAAHAYFMSQFVWWFQALLLKTSSSLPSKYFPRQKPSIFNLSNFPTIIRAVFVRFNPVERLEQRSVSLNRPWARGTRTGSMSVTMSGMMLSPKMQRMQRSVRINDGQLLGLAEKARYDSRLSGYLYKRSSDNSKWLLRWFRLYQVRACADWNIWMDYFQNG